MFSSPYATATCQSLLEIIIPYEGLSRATIGLRMRLRYGNIDAGREGT